MNYTPRSVFTGKGGDGNKITMMEWDFNTWAGFEIANNLVMLILLLALCSIASPIMLCIAIYNFSGRNKLQYLIGMIVSGYFLYDCSHGWIVLCTINLPFDESIINYLVGLNVASFILFTIFLLVGGMLYDFIESAFSELLDRWCIFLGIVLVIGILSVMITTNEKEKHKGWITANIHEITESDKQEMREQKERDEKGSFESKEARDKYFVEMQKKYGN